MIVRKKRKEKMHVNAKKAFILLMGTSRTEFCGHKRSHAYVSNSTFIYWNIRKIYQNLQCDVNKSIMKYLIDLVLRLSGREAGMLQCRL